MKKKILIFNPYLAPYRIDLFNKLMNSFCTRVALFGGDKELATLGYNLELINKQAKFPYHYYKDGLRVGRHLISTIYFNLIRSYHPNIVFTYELGVNTIAAILLKSFFHYKIFSTIDDSYDMAINCSIKREWLRKFVFSHIDGALVVNPKVKEYFGEKYAKLPCKYLYFPIIQDDRVLSDKIERSGELARQYMDKYGLVDKRIILFVGRLEKMKCPDLLIRSFISLKRTDFVLVIVGDGSLRQGLKEIAISSGNQNIIFTGRLSGESLYVWYYLANIFVLPSSYEPFGAVVNEALVAGCYTIVSDKIGASCLINDNNGSIFKSNSQKALECALSTAISKVPLEKNHKNLMDRHFQEYFSSLIQLINQS